MKNKVHPSIFSVFVKFKKVINLSCDSTIQPIWIYSQFKGLKGKQKELDAKGQKNTSLILQLLDFWEQGYYYCIGQDNVTDQIFISEAEVRMYGTSLLIFFN